MLRPINYLSIRGVEDRFEMSAGFDRTLNDAYALRWRGVIVFSGALYGTFLDEFGVAVSSTRPAL
jgi:hypothetical protein